MIEPMLEKLFGSKSGAAAPEGARIYAVGDIHGRVDLLDELLSAIEGERAAGVEKQLVFLGDYVDRGPESRAVVERLVSIRDSRPDAVFLKGNHEAVLLDFLAQPDEAADWLHWGGVETLQSYGVSRPLYREPRDVAAEFRAALPTAHLEFLGALEPYRVLGDYVFVHAGVKPGRALAAQEERDLLWIRGEFHDAPLELRPDKVVVHGHHPIKKPLDAGWRIAVDTGACFSGKLTAVVLEGTSRRFLST